LLLLLQPYRQLKVAEVRRQCGPIGVDPRLQKRRIDLSSFRLKVTCLRLKFMACTTGRKWETLTRTSPPLDIPPDPHLGVASSIPDHISLGFFGQSGDWAGFIRVQGVSKRALQL
jgi:hypothetical protein